MVAPPVKVAHPKSLHSDVPNKPILLGLVRQMRRVVSS